MEVMRKAHAQHNLPTDMAALSKLPNATPGVPAGMPSDHMKYLKDPALQQVRLSCDNAQLSLFGGGHVSGTGRLLLVADQKNEAIRSASLQRSDVDPHMAVADVRASLADLTARYGAPTWSQGTIPDANGTFSHLDHVVRRWDFAGVSVELSAVDFAARGVAVSEEVHVPCREKRAESSKFQKAPGESCGNQGNTDVLCYCSHCTTSHCHANKYYQSRHQDDLFQ